jgi:membrane protein implicated in regulation of membrane protease activity
MDFNTLVTLLAEIGPWHWLVLGALLIGLEAIMPSTYLLWPGIAAVVIGLVVAIDPEMGWQYQVLAFGILAIVASMGGRRWASKGGIVTDQPQLNRRSAQYVGRLAIVTETFVGGRGQITIDDTRWSAETIDGSNPSKNINVEIIAADGALLKVRAIGQ